MEPAKIDWKKVEWNFAVDELYEHINAPKWVDFLSLDHSPLDKDDDEAWFCKPDCKHPKTAEDYLRSTTPFKARSPVYLSENLPCGDQNRRDVKIKRRVPPLPSSSPQDDKFRFNEDSENQNPNMFTPPIKSMKAGIKSSEEKKKLVDDTFQDNLVVPSLRSTLSAKNLFTKRPILNQITEFCNELKKLALATRARERENDENLSPIESEQEVVQEKTPPFRALEESDRREKERKPLLEVGKAERSEGLCVKGKLNRKKRPDEAENMPITLDLENVRHKRENSIQQIRTNPPSPQCFSANKTASSKASKSRLMERGILEEVEQNNEVATKNSPTDNRKSITIIDGRETKALDMFWFFKPCTMSS